MDVFLPTLLAMAPARANQIKPTQMDSALPWRHVKVVFTTRETTFAQLDPQNAPKLLWSQVCAPHVTPHLLMIQLLILVNAIQISTRMQPVLAKLVHKTALHVRPLQELALDAHQRLLWRIHRAPATRLQLKRHLL